MKLRAAVVVFALAGAACSSMPPVAVSAGDVCTRCRRPILDVRMATEIVDPAGRAFKFRTPGCLATYLREHPEEVARIYVTDYATGRMITASSATFVPALVGEGYERTRDYLAFKSEADAGQAAAREKTTPVEWKAVLAGAN
jgi:hypothetical protein